MSRVDYIIETEWVDLPSKDTPITADRLNHIEEGISVASVDRALKEIYDDEAISLGRASGSTSGTNSSATGSGVVASGNYSHAEGSSTNATGYASHAEGGSTTAAGYEAHAEGYSTKALGEYSHAEGYGTTVNGNRAHAEGENTTATGAASHAEGGNSGATAIYSHAEGSSTQASGEYAHSEGTNTVASALASHAEGYSTTASQNVTHAEGYQTKAYAPYSHVEGYYTTASGQYQHVQGKYNATNSNAAFIIGGGESSSNLKNIFVVDWEGNLVITGDITNGSNLSLENIYDLIKSQTTSTVLTADDDLDNVEATGIYEIQDSAIPLNVPSNYGEYPGSLKTTLFSNSNYVTQELWKFNDGVSEIYVRCRVDDTWSEWREIALSAINE
ncbi:MAG: hypothetical protein LUI12_01715 [Clostridiales bacterium]|nr:hypothetical protein [Clostridiales bacterium]